MIIFQLKSINYNKNKEIENEQKKDVEKAKYIVNATNKISEFKDISSEKMTQFAVKAAMKDLSVVDDIAKSNNGDVRQTVLLTY